MWLGCWPETNRLTDISPAMMRSPAYLRLAENCNSQSATMVSHLPSPPTAREGDCFLDRRGSWEWEGYRGKKKKKKEFMALCWLNPCQERREVFLLLVGLWCLSVWELPLLGFQLHLIRYLLFFCKMLEKYMLYTCIWTESQ